MNYLESSLKDCKSELHIACTLRSSLQNISDEHVTGYFRLSNPVPPLMEVTARQCLRASLDASSTS